MAKRVQYAEWSKEDLVKEIEALKKQKTYGLVWEKDKTKEVFDYYINWDGIKTEEKFPEAEHKFPVLKEVKGKEISTGKNGEYNLLIEGDNYHSLAVLNFTHHEAIDVIYIDPPYNTGKKDFKYNDNWVELEDSYRHSKWLSFMERRLKLAKGLLKDTGVIFISIDDNEQAQLKILCDEIFGEKNFLANILWKKRAGAPNDKILGTIHEYILCYAKRIESVKIYRKTRTEEQLNRYQNPDNHPKGAWAADNLMSNVKGGRYVKSLYFPIINPKTGEKFFPSSNGNWRFNRERIDELLKNNEIYFGKDGDGRPKLKRFLSEVKDGTPFSTIWDGVGYNNTATSEIMNLFGTVNIFDTPKPIGLIKEILSLSTNNKKDYTVLDFFAGSGTTGHAVLELNKEDNGNRRFILCTNNENGICNDICYPRIEKSIKGYKTSSKEAIEGLGGNLKYFKTDFVESEPTDKNKHKIVDKSTEMLCMKENAFEEVREEEGYKIFRNDKVHVGIVFNEEALEEFIKEAKKIQGHFNVYAFSLDESVSEKEFKDLKGRVTLCPIPEVILHIYKRIFKDD